ncbi:MAG: ATP-binding protein [Anaerolineales bacterium]
MTSKRLRGVRNPIFRSLSLRWQLTLWTAGLIFLLGLGLTLFTNVLSSIRVPQVVTVELIPTHIPQGAASSGSSESSTDPAVPSNDEANISVIEHIQDIVIREVRFITVAGAALFAAIGALGTYWVAQQAFRPLQHLNRLVQEIRVDSLDRRLSLDRPQGELKKLADAFDNMLDRLEKAFKQQERFVADAAHELRTPLANMRANLDVIQQDSAADMEDYRELSMTINRSLDRLEGLVEDLLLLAKGEREIQKEPVQLEVLLTEVIRDLEPLAQKHQVAVHLGQTEEAILLADPFMLSRAFSNLFINGIQYNQPDGTVDISVHRKGNEVIVTVEDTGIGIPQDALPHIFDRFYRVDPSRDRHRGGAGLGLSITAHIVQLHGGSIEAESSPGSGSSFTIRIPIP